MTLETTLISLVRSRVVAQLERVGCVILYSLGPKYPEEPKKLQDLIFWGWRFSALPETQSGDMLKKNSKTLLVTIDPKQRHVQ